MQTENLNEMIQPDSKQSTDSGLPNYMYAIYTEKLTYDNVKQELANTEKVVPDSIPQVEVVPEISTTDVKTNNYQPESEESLIAYASSIHNKVQTYSIGGYWEIGRTINSFYHGKYGTQELERISIATGIGRDTLNKMCKFAKQYSSDQVEVLLSGAFYVSWFQISQNLSVDPEKMIQVYRETADPKTFHNVIMKFKDPREPRGRSKGTSISVPAVVSEPSITGRVIEARILNEASPENVIEVNLIQTPGDQVKEIDDLRVENRKLRADLDHREYQVNQMEELFQESALDLSSRDKLIEKLRATLNQVHDMVENGYDHVNILSQINWHVE